MGSRQCSHLTGLSLHSSSCVLTSSPFDLSKVHPSYLHLVLGSCSKIFSKHKFLVSTSFPRHTGQGLAWALSGSLQVWHSPCPFSQRYTGGSLMVSRQTGHSKDLATQLGNFLFLPDDAMVMSWWIVLCGTLGTWNKVVAIIFHFFPPKMFSITQEQMTIKLSTRMYLRPAEVASLFTSFSYLFIFLKTINIQKQNLPMFKKQRAKFLLNVPKVPKIRKSQCPSLRKIKGSGLKSLTFPEEKRRDPF